MSMLSTTKYRNSCLILAMFFALVLQHSANGQTVLHVDGDDGLAVPNPPDPGDTWANAFKYLQDALALARANATPANPYQLWVAETDVSNPYRPDRDAANPDGTGLRTSTFLLDFNDVQVLGGFVGNEIDVDDRDPLNIITVLSGAITNPWENCEPGAVDCFTAAPMGVPGCNNMCDGNSCPGCCEFVCEIDPGCCDDWWDVFCAAGAEELCPGAEAPYGAYHVVTANSVDASTLLDGFTITQGSAIGGPGDAAWGAGMLITDSSLSIVRCLITGNSAPAHGGGAMHIQGNSNPLLVNCSLTNNNGGQGGAIHTEFGDIGPTLVNCLLADNFTTFVNPNTDHGGAIDHGGGSPQNPMVLINCTIVNNDGFEGAIYLHFGAHIIIVNSVLWNPGTAEIFIGFQGGSADVTYSDVEGGWGDPMDMNIDEDPLFVDPDNGDYRLDADSPCIEKGNNDDLVCDQFDLDNDGVTCDEMDPDFDEATPDLDLGDRVVVGDEISGADVDMGAYEFVPCPWDIDGDCVVGAADLLNLLFNWGPCIGCAADFDGDDIVGASDLLAMLFNWGPCYCAEAGTVVPTIDEEMAAHCLTMDDWDKFVDKMQNGTEAEKKNYLCWMLHYLDECSRCFCTGQANCPGPDPYNG